MSDETLTVEEEAFKTAAESDDGAAEAPVEAPAEAPEEAPEEPQADQDAPQKPPEGYVPHQAMHQQRELRKIAEARVRELEAQIEAQKAQTQAEPSLDDMIAQLPDQFENPEGFRDGLKRILSGVRQPVDQFQQQQRQQAELSQLQQYCAGYENMFRANRPDYDAALDYARQSRAKELEIFGTPPHQIEQIIRQDMIQVVAMARANGTNPAQQFYDFALSRGYKPAGEPAAEKITRLADTQRKTESLGGAPGGTPGELSLEQIAAMSEDEIANLPEEAKRKALGG